ncbi:NosR/NirI family protein [Denitratisoma oestradiolicum]|uniref:4Fe-4S binding protein n=1 Tax=Denitratisoma oestradiolicum TaxID=311182 RepID=A0A6S6Y0R6_9PROT|nr:NosR/NirI family protein [Denitratisoma oestradiolicum]TWO80791.1 4Fe-4S binding protein [Denitratisoma oestradiolicum]CAB1370893.1 4Fe-4S binding protein [Denitratisoma oestradiolicum]
MSSNLNSLFLRCLCWVLFLCWTGGALATSYEAQLPAELNSSPRLCDFVPCGEVMPGAVEFSERKGRPPYVEAYSRVAGKRQLMGYVFLSTDIVDIPAYSGKPVVTLIGMDAEGRFTGSKILKHSEPILLLGIPESELVKFTRQYVGRFVGDKLEIGKSGQDDEAIGLDAITGATVTVIAQNQVMLRCGAEVAKQVGIMKPVLLPAAKFTAAEAPRSWQELMDEGSIQFLGIKPEDVGKEGRGQAYLDMWFGYLNQPAVGKSLLGEEGYASLMSRLKPDEHAIFIIARGSDSFKGSGFVRGGIYDRVQVRQGMETHTFRDLDYLNLYSVAASGVPDYRESAIFIIRSGNFSAAYPWQLVLLANKVDPESGARQFTSFHREYWLPAKYLEGGRPLVERTDPTWLKVWKGRLPEIIGFIALLAFAALVYGQRDRLVRRSTRKDKRWVSLPKYFIWTASIVFVGFHAMAQPSVTQVLTWFHAMLYQWKWELFLSDPLIFVFWWFIILSIFFWGRGLFCGWLCPFGSLTEMLYKLAGRLGLKRFQFKLPQVWHDRLKWLKYGIFYGLLGISFFSMGLAEMLAEVEPFKTTFLVGLFNRAWPYTLFAGSLLGISLFIERPFCKYLCPLGAALALPSTFRWFGLKRKQECGPCAACAVGCGSLAIDAAGRIDQRECLLCLDCMVMYYDDHACPPLVQERKQRGKAGQSLTPIGSDGYYIPIKPLPAGAPAHKSAVAARSKADPTMLTDPALPPYADHEGDLIGLIAAETWDHLWPWSHHGFQRQRAVQGLGLALAVTVTVMWILAAMGQLSEGVVLGWWFGWSLFEVVVRLGSKPYVKEGPWLGRRYRKADTMDMVCYVGFKNLLIGAALFILLKPLGLF